MSSFSHPAMDVVQENTENVIDDEVETLMDDSEVAEEINDENQDTTKLHTDNDALSRFQIIVDPQLTHAKKEHHVLTCFWCKAGKDALQMSSSDFRKKLDLGFKAVFSDSLMRSVRMPPGHLPWQDEKDDTNVFKLKPLVKPTKNRLPTKGPGAATDSAILMSRACELLIMEMTIKAVLVCQDTDRLVIDTRDIHRIVQTTENYDIFLPMLSVRTDK